jgi:UTP--glucose-1-phosphate uridylyltransferase
MSFPIATAISAMRLEKPHSLSYQAITETKLPSITLVWSSAKEDEAGLWLKSTDTSLSCMSSSCAFAVETVSPDDIYKYGVVVPAESAGELAFDITGLVEKPDRSSAPSNLAIVPRYVFGPSLFDAIRLTLPGKNGEIWLTDSIAILLKQGRRVRCVRLGANETRYDIGNFETYFKAFVDMALADEKYGYTLRQHLNSLALDV